jgi:hypothetical protein
VEGAKKFKICKKYLGIEIIEPHLCEVKKRRGGRKKKLVKYENRKVIHFRVRQVYVFSSAKTRFQDRGEAEGLIILSESSG